MPRGSFHGFGDKSCWLVEYSDNIVSLAETSVQVREIDRPRLHLTRDLGSSGHLTAQKLSA
jgi:hypothetical protein